VFFYDPRAADRELKRTRFFVYPVEFNFLEARYDAGKDAADACPPKPGCWPMVARRAIDVCP
jgi:hypothetical protein